MNPRCDDDLVQMVQTPGSHGRVCCFVYTALQDSVLKNQIPKLYGVITRYKLIAEPCPTLPYGLLDGTEKSGRSVDQRIALMIPSPAKRRKSNSSTAIPVLQPSHGGDPTFDPDGRVSDSNRASFLSPTKASLARTQPELLSRVLGQSAGERTRRSEDRAIELQKGETGERSRVRSRRDASQSTIDDLNLAVTDAAGVLDADRDPETESRAPRLLKADNGSTRRSARRALFSSRLPLARSQVSASSAMPDVVSIAARKRVREEVLDIPQADNDEGEPELPPTPTQLGLQTLSLRSRVLVSSSPSLRLEQRKRRASQQQYVSSPLKPQDGQPLQVEVEADDVTASAALPEEKVPKELREKTKLRDELAAQLGRLKEETANLEDFSQRLEQPDEYGPLSEVSINRLLLVVILKNLLLSTV